MLGFFLPPQDGLVLTQGFLDAGIGSTRFGAHTVITTKPTPNLSANSQSGACQPKTLELSEPGGREALRIIRAHSGFQPGIATSGAGTVRTNSRAPGVGGDVVEGTGALVSSTMGVGVCVIACGGGWSDAGAGADTWDARIWASRASTTAWTCLPVIFPAGAILTAWDQASAHALRGKRLSGRSWRSLPACEKEPDAVVASSRSAYSSS